MKRNFQLSIFIITFILCFIVSIGIGFAEKGTVKDRKVGEKTQGDRWHRADRSKFYQEYADKWQKDHQIVVLMHYPTNHLKDRGDEFFTFANTDLGCTKITSPMKWDYSTFRNIKCTGNVTRVISPKGEYLFTRDKSSMMSYHSDVVKFSFAYYEYLQTNHYRMIANTNSWELRAEPELSPCGKKVLYRIGGEKGRDAYHDFSLSIFDLTKPSDTIPGGMPDGYHHFPENFSPDGKYINLHLVGFPEYDESSDISKWDIIIVNTDNPDDFFVLKTDHQDNYEREENDHRYIQYNEQWSWDGMNIIFSRINKRKQGVVKTVNLESGKTETLLKIDKADYNWYPELEWTEKGILITTRDALYFKGNSDKAVSKLDIPVKTSFICNGRLSPEGERVLFLGKGDDKTYLFVFNIRNGNLVKKRFTSSSRVNMDDFYAAWTYPDRNSVISETNRTWALSEYGVVGSKEKREKYQGPNPYNPYLEQLPEPPPNPVFHPFKPEKKPFYVPDSK